MWAEGDQPGLLCSAKALKMFKPYLSLGEERRPRTEEKAGPSHRRNTKSNTKQRNFAVRTKLANMLHPLMIGIITVNTSMTIAYWIFILTEAFHKKTDDETEKVNPA